MFDEMAKRAQPLDPSKRARTAPDGTEQPSPTSHATFQSERLKDARFPARITALPHVLKLIDTFLMPLEDALTEAARRGGKDWVQNIIFRLEWVVSDEGVSEALEAAAANGHYQVTEFLLDHVLPSERRDDPHKIVQKAANAAAKNGHLEVVKLLVPKALEPYHIHPLARLRLPMKFVLEAAVGGGQLNTVEFVVKDAKEKGYAEIVESFGSGDALFQAIEGGNEKMVHVLLDQDVIRWDLRQAFTAAVDRNQRSLAEKIFRKGMASGTANRLGSDLATGGHADAIKYLYNNWPNDLVWVSSAFVGAAECGETKIAAFLLGTGCISSEVFDLALGVAASPDWCGDRNIETAIFLCEKKLASPALVDQVFESAKYFPLIKYLYENEGVSDKAIFATFEHAARMGAIEIFKFLYDEKSDSIPSEVLSRVFRTVVEHRLAKFFECLRHNPRISSEAIDAAFVSAAHSCDRIVLRSLFEERQISPNAVDAAFVSVARNGDMVMLNLLYEKRLISPEVILKAFQAVSSCERGFSRVGGELVRYLCESRVPREFKYEALLHAVGEGRTLAMVQEVLSKTRDWPLDILKKALDTARDDNTRNWVRKMICDQIFGGNPQKITVGCGCGHVVNELVWSGDK